MLYRRLHHDVGVEDDVHMPPVERDVFPLRQGCLPAMLIGPTPVPDSEQRHCAQSAGREGVALLYPLSDPERNGRVTKPIAHGGVHVYRHARAVWCLVLECLAVFDPRLVWTGLVENHLACGREDGHEEGG